MTTDQLQAAAKIAAEKLFPGIVKRRDECLQCSVPTVHQAARHYQAFLDDSAADIVAALEEFLP